jgi:hypothetical protein
MSSKHGFVGFADTPDTCSVFGCMTPREVHEVSFAVNPCYGCGCDTVFGRGSFVNRVPADTTSDGRDGYYCAECVGADIDDEETE